jgi:hypothetical protein
MTTPANQEEADRRAADREFEKYWKENHPDTSEGGNVYENIPIITSDEQAKKEEAPLSLEAGAAGAGAWASHKGWGSKILNPGESVYSPVAKPQGSPFRTSPVEHYINEPNSNVSKIMQSERESGPTGRQMERGHNWETNRESLATKGNLNKLPGAPEALVRAGPMAPTSGGIAIPANVARELEEEKLRKQDVAKQRAEAQLNAEKAQAEAAGKGSSRTGKVLGVAKGVAKVGSGAIGAALSAKDIWDLYHAHKKEGYSDEEIGKMIQAVGGLAMIGNPLVGLAGVAAGEAYPYVAKYYREHSH